MRSDLPSGTVTFLFTDVEGISSKATTTITTTLALLPFIGGSLLFRGIVATKTLPDRRAVKR